MNTVTPFQQLTTKAFRKPCDIINFLTANNIVARVDPDTLDRIYAINPESNRSYTFLVKERANGYLFLEKI